MSILVLYGTETGNAEMLAEDMAAHLGNATLKPMAGALATDLAGVRFAVIISSTYGEGELPSGARPFHEAVTAARPDLSQLSFAAFSLGDQATYPDTFARGGAVWAETLTGLGARQIGPLGIHDASGADLAEDIALPWIDAILAGHGTD